MKEETIRQRRISEALEWAAAGCKLTEGKMHSEDPLAMLRMAGPIRHFYSESVAPTGRQLAPLVYAASYPKATAAIVSMYEHYMLLEAARDMLGPKLAGMSLEELEGLLDYITNELETKTTLTKAIVGMTAEELATALERVRDELQKRRRDAAESARESRGMPAGRAEELATALHELGEAIRRGYHGN